MAHTVTEGEPTVLAAGDSWQWDRAVSDYPPSEGYALTYHLSGRARYEIAASASETGDYFEVRTTPAAHAALVEGEYRLLGFVTLGDTERWPVYDGRVYVHANPLTLDGDTRSFAARMVDVLEAAVAGRELPEHEELEINGRRIKYASRTDQMAELGKYRLIVAAERNGGFPPSILQGVQFARAS